MLSNPYKHYSHLKRLYRLSGNRRRVLPVVYGLSRAIQYVELPNTEALPSCLEINPVVDRVDILLCQTICCDRGQSKTNGKS